MTDTLPKWKVVENVVAAIERSLNSVQGSEVIPNASIPERTSGVPRQVDVYVEVPTGPRTLRIGIEVRDKSAALDLPEVEQLTAKLKKLDLDMGCIVSASGFTATAKDEGRRNGIELRNVTEIKNPNWWLASTMLLDLRQVELVQCQVNFRPDELASVSELLGRVDGTELQLTLANGESGTLTAFMNSQGLRAVDGPELSHLKDQDTFAATIEFSDLDGATMRCPRGPLPLPRSVYALYRFHHRIESVPLAAYQAGDEINAFTGVSSSWGKQVTMVTKLQPDGARSLSFAFNDPCPPKTTIGSRSQDVEQSLPAAAHKNARG